MMMMIMMMMVMLMMILINDIEKRKSRFFFFFTISSLRRELCPIRTLKWPGLNCVQITCITSGAYHVQHAVYQVVQKGSLAVKFDRAEIAVILV